MKNNNIFFFFALILLFASCETAFMDKNPETDVFSIFDEYTILVKEKYAMLETKGVDIDVLSTSLRSTLHSTSTEAELFHAMGEITLALRDGHSALIKDKTNPTELFASFDVQAGYPIVYNFAETLQPYYLGYAVNPTIKTINGGPSGYKAIYGVLPQDNDIGYITIPSWAIELEDQELEQIMYEVKNTKGLIVDLRQNTGGDPALATKFAAYFMNTNTYIGFERFKIGPGNQDFSDSPSTIAPANSSNRYTKPVIVITDRLVYSASTTFLYTVDPLVHVRTLGQHSGGGSGSVADGFLANGWYWSLSTSEFIDANGNHLDDGVEPDIPVIYNPNDVTKDEFIEAAILELQ